MLKDINSFRLGATPVIAALACYLSACGSNPGTQATGTERGSSLQPHGSAEARVLRVIDGDTIEVSIDGAVDDVRYIGIDTPETVMPGEPVQCFGPEASERNHELVDGRDVHLEFDSELRDAYGRLLAYVYVDHQFVNKRLVAGGYARTLRFPPNIAEASKLATVEKEASQDGEGLWGASC